MQNIEVVNGITVITLEATRFQREFPTYGVWQAFLRTRNCTDLKLTGIDEIPIITEEGKTLFRCICCGIPTERLEMNQVRIGGLIRIPTEESTGDKEITKSYKLTPVSKMGSACIPCQSRYAEAVKVANKENAERLRINATQAEHARLVNKLDHLVHGGQIDRTPCERHRLPMYACTICNRQQTRKPTMVKLKPLVMPTIDVLFDWKSWATWNADTKQWDIEF